MPKIRDLGISSIRVAGECGPQSCPQPSKPPCAGSQEPCPDASGTQPSATCGPKPKPPRFTAAAIDQLKQQMQQYVAR